jgi:dienelactone hydrolase
LSLDLFLTTHTARAKPLPVFVIFNGFGGEFMRTSAQSQAWAKAATAHGFAAVTAETTAEHVAEDFDSLVFYLRQHAENLHIDPDRLVVIAWSGNVSAGLPIVENPQRRAIKAAAIYYGSADVPQVRLDLPVLFVRAGLDQPLSNQSFDRTIAAGMAANAPWTVLNYPGGHHGFDVLDDNDLSREIIEETFRFAQLAISDSHQSALHGGLAEATAAGAMFTEDFARAAVLYRELVAAHPQDAALLLAYGNALSGAKQYKEACAQFDRAKVIGGLGARDLGLPAAEVCALDHNPEAAMAWLKTIPPQFLPASIRSDAAFAELKDRPDFQALFHPH